jgi:hypothetical protein
MSSWLASFSSPSLKCFTAYSLSCSPVISSKGFVLLASFPENAQL